MGNARLLLLLCAIVSISYSTTLYRKHLAGPPSEFSLNKFPLPEEAAIEQRSAIYEIFLTASNSNPVKYVWTGPLAVDSDELFAFNIFSPIQDKLVLSLKDPQGNDVDLTTHIHTGSLSAFPIGLLEIPGINYYFEAPFPKGTYVITITSTEAIQPRADSEPDGLIMLYNESPIKAHTYLNTYSLYLGGQIGLITRLTEDEDGKIQPQAIRDVISKAVMEVHKPDGKEQEVEMYDDGLHFDGEAQDGIYGGFMAATEPGIYRAEAYIEATGSDGSTLVRSTQHLLPIVSEQISFTGLAFASKNTAERLDVVLVVDYDVETINHSYRAYTEVWGTDGNGKEIPICWLAGIVDVQSMEGLDVVVLELDLNWVKLAGAQLPFTLKNVALQDIQVYVPVDQVSEIPLVVSSDLVPKVAAPMAIQITKEMRQGVFPKELLQHRSIKVNTTAAAAPTLALIHGYCSDVNPWSKYSEDFSSATFFLEPKASLSHENFAKLVLAHVQGLGMSHWGGVGHSQGGIVLAHLLNYYFSGLDASTNGRKIQTVGTPFKGCTGAGSAANLIAIFGFGCGENFDLTTDGTSLWLVGITPETRKEVFYYTTTYKQGKLFGDYCNLAVNLLLKWPNDGTSELAYTPLTGANSQGNKEEWCHTTDMGYTAQYYDRDRNKEMNKLASR